MLSHLTLSPRWMAGQGLLHEIVDVTPQAWYAYLDHRIAAWISPSTVNGELSALKHLVHYLQKYEIRVCERFLLVDFLEAGSPLPKDASPGELWQLQKNLPGASSIAASWKVQAGTLVPGLVPAHAP